jgi:hypothetical protein
MAKTQKNLRISQLTDRQLTEMNDAYDFSDTEAITLAVDRLYRDLLRLPEDGDILLDAIRHFTNRIHQLENTGFGDWPQWSGQDMEMLEALLAATQRIAHEKPYGAR